GATTVRATFHRYVIDANRGPDDASLYPGQNTTGLVSLTDFDGRPIWTDPPEPSEIEARLKAFHAPYHAALSAQIERVRARHGVAILYDCHSIRSHIPFLFDGVLPDFNIGTNSGTSCAPQIETALAEIAAASPYSSVLNGRFKGGWTTRHYGRPEAGVHAVQMELAQSTHLASETPPFDYDPARAEALRPYLREMLHRLAALALDLKG
ncbi:MAG: N-formylglutamate deformylase, partial [Paracoccus sp. (in: a-proteobacteria)]|nr:N-formylglutamate deformylase [Paracoccus sp. (in: a-proteobacteria)]